MEVPINIPPPITATESEAEGHWFAKLVACGGRQTLALVEWRTEKSKGSSNYDPNNIGFVLYKCINS